MCHGGTWAGDYVLNVIPTGLSLKARGKRRRQRWVDDGRVLALGESRRSSAISVADVVASLTRDVADFPVPGVEFKDLTPLFADRRGLAAVTEALADRASGADLVARRESNYNANAINHWDSNAARGTPSRGVWQFIAPTFAAYHEPGTSTNIHDLVAQACAFINYARGHYGVAADASNLADLIQQADPRRSPRGY